MSDDLYRKSQPPVGPWADDAACLGVDPDLFFPEQTGPGGDGAGKPRRDDMVTMAHPTYRTFEPCRNWDVVRTWGRETNRSGQLPALEADGGGGNEGPFQPRSG